MIGKPIQEMRSLFEKLEQISQKTEATFTLTISCEEEELPDFIKKFL